MKNNLLKKKHTTIFFFVVVALCNYKVSFCQSIIMQNVEIASSPNPVGSGARAMGMGGAFIAIADDATAASWNPAGLMNLELPEISLVGATHRRSSDFSSSIHPEINTDASKTTNDLNYLSATYPFVLLGRNMVVSLNYQHLYDFTKDYSYSRQDTTEARLEYLDFFGNLITELTTTHSQNNIGMDQLGSLGALGLAYAVKFSEEIWFGVTLNLWTNALGNESGWETKVRRNIITVRENQMYRNGVLISDITTPASSTERIFTEEYQDFSGENFNIGLMWNSGNHLSLGAVLKTPFQASVTHKTTDTSATPMTTSEEVHIDMPMSFGAGIAYRFTDIFSIDCDIYRTLWSKYTLTDSQGNEFNAVTGGFQDQATSKDTTQVRIGGEYLYLHEQKGLIIPFRFGLFYDPEPMKDHVKDFYGFSIGSGVTYKQFVFDLAYQFRWAEDVDASNLIPNAGVEGNEKQHTFLTSIIYHF